MSTTYVSAFLDLREDRSKDKSVERCFTLFQTLASSSIQLHVYLSRSYEALYKERLRDCKTLHVEWIELEDLDIYKRFQGTSYTLPVERNVSHDTAHFLLLMNAKVEFLHKAIQSNVYGTNQFAWIDFSICHVLKDIPGSLDFLKMQGKSRWKKGIHIPGCWPKDYRKEALFQQVHWRFCGGFFLGDRESLLDFHRVYEKGLVYVQEKGILPWEVNLYAYLELYEDWKPLWYGADHNDSILRIPMEEVCCVASLTTIPPRLKEECKKTLDSLLGQVEHIYLNVATKYKRFPKEFELPSYFSEEPYRSSVTVVRGLDYGPATKYLGALSLIDKSSWIFFCDDDQEYKEGLLLSMQRSFQKIGVYQNHYAHILQKTSGGLLHGYVGNCIHASSLLDLPRFPLPDCARFVDDQWISIFCFQKGLPIYATNAEHYQDIFKTLENNHEKWGSCPLASLQNRDQKIQELADFFGVVFKAAGAIEYKRYIE